MRNEVVYVPYCAVDYKGELLGLPTITVYDNIDQSRKVSLQNELIREKNNEIV